MKSASVIVLLGLSATVLTGCASSMRNYLERDTPTQSASVRSDLTMPPDLRLPAPGTTEAAPDPGAMDNEVALTAPPPPAASRTASAAPAAPASPATSAADSIYTQAGISLYKPDGTKKTNAELQQELQAYYIAQKKAKNPKYGTVFNIGNIFKDE